MLLSRELGSEAGLLKQQVALWERQKPRYKMSSKSFLEY